MPGALGEHGHSSPAGPCWQVGVHTASHSHCGALLLLSAVISYAMSQAAACQAPCPRRAAVSFAAQWPAAQSRHPSLSKMRCHVCQHRHTRRSCPIHRRRAASAAPPARRRRRSAALSHAARRRQRSSHLPRPAAGERCCWALGCCWPAAPPARPAAERPRQPTAVQQPAAVRSLCPSPTRLKATPCCDPPAGSRWAGFLGWHSAGHCKWYGRHAGEGGRHAMDRFAPKTFPARLHMPPAWLPAAWPPVPGHLTSLSWLCSRSFCGPAGGQGRCRCLVPRSSQEEQQRGGDGLPSDN